MARLFARASSEYLEIDSAPVTAVPLTIAFWFVSDSLTVRQVGVSLVDKDATNMLFVVGPDGSATGDPVIAVVSSASGAGVAVSSAGYSANVWQHAAGVFTSTTSRTAYLNGGNAGTNTTNITPANIDRLSIGRAGDSSPTDYISGSLAEVGIWSAALDAAEIASLAAGVSPLVIRPESLAFYCPLVRDDDEDIVGGLSLTAYNTPDISAHPRVVHPVSGYVVPASGTAATALTVANAAQAQTVDNVGLTQHQVLTVANAAQAQTVGAVVLTQHQVLTVANAAQAQTVGAVVLTQHQVLTVANAAQAQTVGAVVLTQHQVLTVANAAQAQTVGAVVLTQHQVLTVAGTSQDQTVGAVTLTQHHVLAVAGVSQAQTVDSFTLGVSGLLVVQYASQAQTADTVTLTQHHRLSVNDAIQNQTVDNVTLSASGPTGPTTPVSLTLTARGYGLTLYPADKSLTLDAREGFTAENPIAIPDETDYWQFGSGDNIVWQDEVINPFTLSAREQTLTIRSRDITWTVEAAV